MGERKLVRDLMSVGVPTCSLQTPLQQVARLLIDTDIDCVVVIDPEGHAQGVVSQDDLVNIYTQGGWDQLVAEDVMQENVPQVPADIPLSAAAQIMRDQHVRSVFLMHHAGGIIYSAAVLTYKHFLRHMAARDDSELKDLGNQAARKGPLEAFIERRDAARRKTISHSEET
jgi:predicted transcriptional regulator